MCGIIGYIGSKDASPILLEGLRRLEYRGYDSSGMAVLGESSIEVTKDVGRVDSITAAAAELRGNIGIAHTRWATHGGVTRENAHPHLSSDGSIAVVHNGIVENHGELRKKLNLLGYIFQSETDTEIIPKLIEHGMRSGIGFTEATTNALSMLEGRYAILALHKDGTMIASRRGSPLVLGVGEGEVFAASDIPAFMEHTKSVVYLQDHDLAVINGGSVKILDTRTGTTVQRTVDTISWNAERVEKGDFEHYMLKEISEQAETLGRVQHNEAFVKMLATDFKSSRNVMLIAAGTAYHACLCGSHILSRVAKRHVLPVRTSEFETFSHLVDTDTLIIAVSQSGETADTVEAVEMSKKAGAKVVSIVNVPGSTLHRESTYALLTDAGPEIGVASTKAYTSQLAVLTLLAYAVQGDYDEGKRAVGVARNQAYNLTAASTRTHLQRLAETMKGKEHAFTLGRGLEYATSKEAALKIKEVSYIHVEAFAAGELKHGTIALIEKGTPCIFFFSEANAKETLSNAQEVKARGAYVIGVGPEKDPVFDFFIRVPEVGLCNPILQIIPMQLLAYQLSVLRGNDPDHPKNLAKSVTVK